MFILASASPRRRDLLEQIGCRFRVRVSHAEELAGDDLPPEELALKNARAKALTVAKDETMPVLGADSVVALDGHIYGKPADEADARAMIGRLAGKTHIVSTGIAFVNAGEMFSDVRSTEVTFAPMTEEEIAAYVATGEFAGKAGGYALQGKAAAYIEGIRGSYTNVVGLPLHAVRMLARKAGVDLHGDDGAGPAR